MAATQTRGAGSTAKIGLIPCLAFAVGTMIGGGVFTLSGVAVDEAGPSALFAYLLAGGVMLLSALCFAAVSSRSGPGDSGYASIGSILGPQWRFLTMWAFYNAATSPSSARDLGYATRRRSRSVLLSRSPPSAVTTTMSSMRTPKRPGR